MDPDRWDAILAEAARAFAHYGFKKTAMEDVARAAGVAKGTLYLGCSSKQDLFYQAILRDIRLWNAELARAIDPRVPGDELLVRLSQQAFETRDRHPLALGLIMAEFEEEVGSWAERLDELRGQSLSAILEVLRIGVRQGRFRAELDLEEVAGLLLDVITSTMFMARGPQAEERLARRALVAYDLLLRGLLRAPHSPD